MSQKVRPCNLCNVFSKVVFFSIFFFFCFMHARSLCRPPFFLSFPRSDARHVCLPFAFDHQCQHLIPVWISLVTRSSHVYMHAFAFRSPRPSVIKQKHQRKMAIKWQNCWGQEAMTKVTKSSLFFVHYNFMYYHFNASARII